MTHQIVFRPVADAEVESAYRWYESQRTGLGDQFLDRLDSFLALAAGNPRIYPVFYKQFRQGRVSRFPYVVTYRVESTTVVVVSVRHGGRDPDDLLAHLDTDLDADASDSEESDSDAD